MDDYSSPQSRPKSTNGSPSRSTPQATVAAFSPNQQTASRAQHSSSVLIHQKSPLLIATPPQVTRALAYSHPFILPLNQIVGLLSWTTGDPWESFLLVAAFWFTVLYGDTVTQWAGPVVLVAGLIAGMYSRRYSPLSSTVWSGEKQKRKRADSEQQRKSLDEIVETLHVFTSRCEVLLDPFLRLTQFLSTQSSATSATTRPALTTLFLRILAFTPIWILLTLPPLHIITTQRNILALGTLGLTWHSRPARVCRTILWRSRTLRDLCSLLTGLTFAPPVPTGSNPPTLPPRKNGISTFAKAGKSSKPGIRFTFTLYENQRRWLGLGWTPSLLAYERQAWTDEHLNDSPEPSSFALPETSENDSTKWRWVPGSEWRVEGAVSEREKSAKRIGGGGGGDECGWVYYDNKWHDGRKVDGWGRYTRRRKWVRDAELVDMSSVDESSEQATTTGSTATDFAQSSSSAPAATASAITTSAATSSGTDPMTPVNRKAWFARQQSQKGKSIDSTLSDKASHTGSGSTGGTGRSQRERDSPEDDVHTPVRYRHGSEWLDRSIGDGIAEGLS